MDILEEIGKRSVQEHIANGMRIDGRKPEDYRKISVQKNVVPNANGSALCKLGKSQILAAVKFGIGAPYQDKPDEGTLSFNAEFAALASPSFEQGPPGEDSIEVARVIDRGFRSSGIIDLKKFFIDQKNVLMMYVDLHVLDYDGNLFDAGYIATMAALQCTRLPKIVTEEEEVKLVPGEYAGNLELKGIVLSSTFAIVRGTVLADPSSSEEAGMDAGLVVATDGNDLVAMQKLGFAGMTKEQILKIVDMGLAKWQELKRVLE